MRACGSAYRFPRVPPASNTAAAEAACPKPYVAIWGDRKSTRLNSSHANTSYAVFRFKQTCRCACHASVQSDLVLIVLLGGDARSALAQLLAHLGNVLPTGA